MATTIQVEEETLDILKRLREGFNVASYNEVIMKMVEKTKRGKGSLYGVLGRKPIKEVVKGLRDEKDRI
jgi:predicted CopG family antitoxin